MTRTLKFNPGFQSDEEAIANFVVRREELTLVTEAFTRAGERGARPARVLVAGPRGAGKTTLCRRLLAEIRRTADLRQRWYPIFLAEESYAVTTPGEFFLECLYQLNQFTHGELDQEYRRAVESSTDDQLLKRTLGTLRSFADGLDKRLLIIVENFHVILRDQIGGDAQALLEYLRDNSLFGVLATSVAQSSIENEASLPDDYLSVTLQPLSLRECHELWTALTGQEVRAERIRPLQILTGGSPRLMNILAEFMKTPSLRDLMGNLNLLIDQYTEYFKSQLDALPTTERKVFAALLDAWDPSTAKQIADAARVNTNIASAMLTRLSERGAVVKAPGRGRTAIYHAAERLFNIYYLMRRRSHPSSRVRALVSFMTEYYDRDELIDTTAILVREACAVEPERRGDYHSTFDAILLHASDAERTRILEQTPEDFIRSYQDFKNSLRARSFDVARRDRGARVVSEDDKFEKIRKEVEAAFEASRFDEALELLRKATKSKASTTDLWVMRSLLHQHRGEYDEAVEAATQALERRPDDPWPHALLGVSLEAMGRRSEAERALLRALDLDSTNTLALREFAEILEEKGDMDGALALYERAHSSGELSDDLRSRYGLALRQRGRLDEAEDVLRADINDPASIETRRALVDLLDATGRQEEGAELLRQAAARQDRWEVWADLGSFLLARTTHAAEAKQALLASVEKGASEPSIYRRLAHAMSHTADPPHEIASVADRLTERLSDKARAWTTAAEIYEGVGQVDRAEAAYRTATEHKEGAFARVLLARFLQSLPNRRAEAEAVLQQAIAVASGRAACAPSRELAELLVHNGEDAKADAIASRALQGNTQCVCCHVLLGEICVRKDDLESAKTHFRAALDVQDACIPALTALSRIVSRDLAEELIKRAIDADPKDPRGLLARARIRVNDPHAQIKDAEDALALHPDFLEAHLFLAPLEAQRGSSEKALAHLESALSKLPSRRELVPGFVHAAMAVARYEKSERLGQLLAKHEFGKSIEPLTVALQLARGEQPQVAQEVLEVAKDIVKDT